MSSRKLAVVICALLSAALTPLPAQTSTTFQPSALPQPNLQMSRVLDVFKLISGTPFYNLRPPSARQQFSAEDAAKVVARSSGRQLEPEAIGSIIDQKAILGSDGNMIPIRIYRPAGTGPFPTVLYFHGGGFVIATIDTYDASARALADLTNAVVVSVEYRKAPEHPYPAAVHDALAAYRWALSNIGTYNGSTRKVAVAGESAGGNLATVVCILARNEGLQMPDYQLLIYPYVSTSLNFASVNLYGDAHPLNRPALVYFGRQYVPSGVDPADPLISPLNATLRGLPPATIVAAQIDPLQDEGRAYSIKLQNAGVNVKYRFYNGVTHEFFGMGAVLDVARQAEKDAAADLRAAFSK